FADAETDAGRQTPDDRAADVERLRRRVRFLEMPEEREGFAELFAKAHPEGEAQHAQEEAVARIVRRLVRVADELDEIEQDDQDAAAPDPGALRGHRGPLKPEEQEDADRAHE